MLKSELESALGGALAELAETRETLADWKSRHDALQEQIGAMAGDVTEYRAQRDAEGARAVKAEERLARLMKELSGLTLGMLPPGAYGASLANIYCDIKAGR